MEAEIARIDRKLAETQKFVAERTKLDAEARKLDRERWLAPWILLTSLSSGLVVAIISHFWK